MRAFTVTSRSGSSSRPARVTACHAQAADSNLPTLGRRGALASLVALTAAQHPALADVELTTLYGLATPPTSYGGYGGNVKESPKYKFDYPDTWKQLTVNKVQKVCTIGPHHHCNEASCCGQIVLEQYESTNL